MSRTRSSELVPRGAAPPSTVAMPEDAGQVEALQGLHLDRAGLVDPHEVVAGDERVGAQRGCGSPDGGGRRAEHPTS